MAQENQAQVAGAGQLTELEEFSDILKQTIKPRTEVAAKEVDNAVVALVREALDDQTGRHRIDALQMLADHPVDILAVARIGNIDHDLADIGELAAGRDVIGFQQAEIAMLGDGMPHKG